MAGAQSGGYLEDGAPRGTARRASSGGGGGGGGGDGAGASAALSWVKGPATITLAGASGDSGVVATWCAQKDRKLQRDVSSAHCAKWDRMRASACSRRRASSCARPILTKLSGV